jgi:hypothetical protein
VFEVLTCRRICLDLRLILLHDAEDSLAIDDDFLAVKLTGHPTISIFFILCSNLFHTCYLFFINFNFGWSVVISASSDVREFVPLRDVSEQALNGR